MAQTPKSTIKKRTRLGDKAIKISSIKRTQKVYKNYEEMLKKRKSQ